MLQKQPVMSIRIVRIAVNQRNWLMTAPASGLAFRSRVTILCEFHGRLAATAKGLPSNYIILDTTSSKA